MPEVLLSVEEMSRADALTIAAGTPGLQLMHRAGEAVARACLELLEQTGQDGSIIVLCGPGNNGGDGYVAARRLRDAGHQVSLFALGPETLKGDAAQVRDEWAAPIASLSAAAFPPGCVVIDALFGAGLSRPLSDEVRAVVERCKAPGVAVLAVDVPSGIDGNSGADLGGSMVADVTVTFFRAKPGHYLLPGAERCGRLAVADIGISPAVLGQIRPAAALNVPSLWRDQFPWPARDGHKYKRGHAVAVSGGASTTGAARMSARAALRIGAGLVTLASPAEALAINAAQLTAIMVREADGPEGLGALLADPRKNAVVLGPGLGIGEPTCALVAAALTPAEAKEADVTPRACVLDADALTSFAGQASALGRLVEGAHAPVVITPHDGEFKRLFEADPEIGDQPSKLERARGAARMLGCVVLLKGPDTVVAEPGGRASIAASDAPWLATAGSGDVLSGLITGLLAQGMPAFEAASAAVWIHAEAARRFGPGMIAEDIAEHVPGVLRDLWDQARSTTNQARKPASR